MGRPKKDKQSEEVTFKVGDKVTVLNPSDYDSVKKYNGLTGIVCKEGNMPQVEFKDGTKCSFFIDELEKVK